jgi:hypothetical protein
MESEAAPLRKYNIKDKRWTQLIKQFKLTAAAAPSARQIAKINPKTW